VNFVKSVDGNELRGLVLFLEKNVGTSEKSRQHHSLDISQMDENDEYRLIISRNVTKPSELIGIWLVCLAERPLWKELLRVELGEKCKRYQYKNMWMKLHKILKLDSLDLALYVLLEEVFSARDLRGNILPRALKLWKFCVNFSKMKKRKPRNPQFHRGYRDHGGRRLSHEFHDFSEVSGPNPIKPDFRNRYSRKYFLLNFLYG
jgi:hypothetical protein